MIYVKNKVSGDLPVTKGEDATKLLFEIFTNSKRKKFLNIPIGNLGDVWEQPITHNSQPVRNWESDMCTREKMTIVTTLYVTAHQTPHLARLPLKSHFHYTPCV
jgi:hypothetical protein